MRAIIEIISSVFALITILIRWYILPLALVAWMFISIVQSVARLKDIYTLHAESRGMPQNGLVKTLLLLTKSLMWSSLSVVLFMLFHVVMRTNPGR